METTLTSAFRATTLLRFTRFINLTDNASRLPTALTICPRKCSSFRQYNSHRWNLSSTVEIVMGGLKTLGWSLNSLYSIKRSGYETLSRLLYCSNIVWIKSKFSALQRNSVFAGSFVGKCWFVFSGNSCWFQHDGATCHTTTQQWPFERSCSWTTSWLFPIRFIFIEY